MLPSSSFHFDEKFVKICVQNSCHFDYFLIREESLFTFLVKNSAYLVLVVLAHHFGLSPLPNRHIWLPGSHWHYCPMLSRTHWWIWTEMLNSTAFCGNLFCYWILPNPLMPWQHNASEKLNSADYCWMNNSTLDHGAARNTTEFTSAVTQPSKQARESFWALTTELRHCAVYGAAETIVAESPDRCRYFWILKKKSLFDFLRTNFVFFTSNPW